MGKSEKPEEGRQPAFGSEEGTHLEERIWMLNSLGADASAGLAFSQIYPCVILLGEQDEKDARCQPPVRLITLGHRLFFGL
jgi:hypothetical protein